MGHDASLLQNLHDHLDRVAGACLCIAGADGELDDDEVGMLVESIATCSGGEVDDDTLRRLLQEASVAMLEHGIEGFLSRLGKGLDDEQKRSLLLFAAAIAVSNGTFSEPEREMFGNLAYALGIAREVADQICAAVESSAGPNVDTVKARLFAAGWFDPMAGLIEAGITVEGFGVAFQYDKGAEALLRLELHLDEGAVHFHVTDASDCGMDFAIFYKDNLDRLLDTIIAMQDTVTLETLEPHMRKIHAVCPDLCLIRDGELLRIEAPQPS